MSDRKVGPETALVMSWPWVAVGVGIAALDVALASHGRPTLTSRFRWLRQNAWGKPIAYGAVAGLAAHLLDLR